MAKTLQLPAGCAPEITLNQAKYIAIAAMVIDHIAFAFVPDGTALAIVMHIIGRLTGPIMFFSAVEGYHHTRDLNRYLLRLAAFAAISWFPSLYFKSGGGICPVLPFGGPTSFTQSCWVCWRSGSAGARRSGTQYSRRY